MRVKINEFKKVINSPIIVGLIILFIIFNSFIIFKNSYFKEDLKVLSDIVDRFGYKINDEMETKFKEYYIEKLNRLNTIVKEKESKVYNSVFEFYKDNPYGTLDKYNEEEVEFIKELGIIEAYYYKVKEIDDVYSKIDIMKIAERQIYLYNLTGKAADTVRNQYKDFNVRFHQLINNKEHKNLFFLGENYRMHSLLFKNLFRKVIFEIIILAALITAYLVNYEFDNNTEAITYTTKRGRRLILDKLYTAMVSNIFAATVILITSLSLYFIIYDYSEVWNVPISSYFNGESNLPYMSWWNMSFIQYLFSCVGLVYISTLIFTGITFLITRATKNTYIAFFLFAIIFGLFLAVPSFIPRSSNVIFIGAFTPFYLVMNPFKWFMESGAFTTFKYYELITVSIWLVLLSIFSALSIKKFKKQDIVR